MRIRTKILNQDGRYLKQKAYKPGALPLHQPARCEVKGEVVPVFN
jgi:hypothetical protein